MLNNCEGSLCKPAGTHAHMVSQMLQNSTTCTFIFSNLYLCSTSYIYIQHFIFIFNKTHFPSTSTQVIFIQQQYLFNFNPNYFYSTTIFVQLQPKLFSFNKNNYSTSTKNNFIQQQYLFNFNPNYFHSTKIIIQLQPKIISFNNKVPGHPKYRHSTKFPVPPPEHNAWTGTDAGTG